MDVGQTPQGMPYLVCEYLEGIDLAGHLNNVGTLTLDSALHIARQLCLALDAAHACGVVHRDLKPHNVFLVGDFAEGVPARPYAKVLDFGLSCIVHSDANITRTGIIVGTPAFMAPEQTLGQRADHRADVYGVGAILYKALTGRAPYDQETPHAALTALMKGEPPRLRGLVPSLPLPVELVVERAMARDPAQRYASTKELGRALEQLVGAPSEKPSPSAPPTARNVVMSEEAREAQGARFGLIMWLLASSLALTAASAIAITGVERLMRVRWSPLELKLMLSLVLGKFFMPVVLLLPAIRRAWKNTTKVVALLRHVRASMLAAISAFGFGTLALHVNDRFLSRFVELGPLPTLDPAWQGWNIVLPLIALLAALTTLARRKLLIGKPRTWRRLLAATLVLCCSFGATYGVVHTALRWRAEHSGADAG
jgi:serine/threonine-protein kinase